MRAQHFIFIMTPNPKTNVEDSVQVLSRLSIALFLLFIAACQGDDTAALTGTGTLEANEVTVSSQVSGIIVSLRVTEGAAVGIGDTLVVIDATEWQHQLAQVEANLRAAEAQLKLTLEGPRKEEIAQAQATFESAQTDLARIEELHDAGTVAKKQLDDARTRFTLAEQNLVKLKSGARSAEIDLARARRDQARAQVASLRKRVLDCVVTAPIAGSVVNTFVEAGEFIAPGGAVVRLADLTTMNLVVYLPETVIPRVKLGQKASIAIDAYEKRTFDGVVAFVSPTAEFTPRNIQTKEERAKLVFAVKIRVSNPDQSLKAGLPADATIHPHDKGASQ
ncbi:MAG: HlyD family efflux transporter periplasmic adaptor subunit [Ignavibacteria bacterium]|nr:HlyD family efflux transporter periplasmic adaptor subunit [Ignavibacteria bacterium]